MFGILVFWLLVVLLDVGGFEFARVLVLFDLCGRFDCVAEFVVDG